ncbi:MAG: methyltransferase domain-containing protein [Betaproteobacteria bacterium]
MSIDVRASTPLAADSEPSAWVCRFASLLAPSASVLDVACGGGRHSRYFASRGHAVLAVDRDASRLSLLAGVYGIKTQVVDLEGAAWPFGQQRFGGIVVTHYLFRPLLPHLINALEPGAIFIYETFAQGQQELGRPSNPDFLLRAGELLDCVRGFCRVVAYEDIFEKSPRPRYVQRICAVRDDHPVPSMG